MAKKSSNHLIVSADSLLDSIVVLDNTITIVDANPAAFTFFGFGPDQLIGKKLTDLLLPDDKIAFKKQWKQLLKKNSITGEFALKNAHEKINRAEYSASFHYLPNRHLFVIRDVSDRRENEDRREHLLGIASHELRTPLASIKAYTYILTRSYQKQSKTDPTPYLEKIDEKIDILAKLINDLLDVARIKQEKFELVYEIIDFDQLLKNTVKNLRTTISDHKIVAIGKTDTMLVADKSRITQVLINLVKNASKYSPDNTDITILSKKTDKKVSLSVQDQGMGIPEKEQPKIFNLYYHGKPGKHSEPSLGVGLFISSEIMKQHGGTLTVASRAGKGSTFTMTLPVRSFE